MSTTGDRTRVLVDRASRAATGVWAAGAVAALSWSACVLAYGGTADGDRPGVLVLLFAAVGVAASMLAATFAAASYVLGALAEAESFG